jgi:hypothetical protein
VTSRRPCLACGHENALEAATCETCQAELRAHARKAPSLVFPVPTLGARRPPLFALVGLAAVVGLAAWGALHVGRGQRREAGPTWSDPETVAAWARRELVRHGTRPDSVQALVRAAEEGAEGRRLLVARVPERQGLAEAVSAMAQVLLEARKDPSRTGVHLGILEHAGLPGGPMSSIGLPAGEAAFLAAHPEAVPAWLVEAGHPTAVASRVEPAAEGDASSGAAGTAEAVGTPDGEAPGPPADGRPGEGGPGAAVASDATGSAPEPDAASPVRDEARTDPAVASRAATTPAKPPASSAGAVARPPAPVRLLRGPGAPISPRLAVSQDGAVLLRVQLHPGQRRALLLEAVTIRASGTLDDVSDLEFLHLVQDVDRDGKRGQADRQLGSPESFTDDDATLTFAGLSVSFGADGSPVYLLVLADVADESEGGTLQISVPDASSVQVREVSSEQVCPVSGVPHSGVQFVLSGNVEPDPEQERLDRLAEEGPDAVDPHLEHRQGP